MNELINKFSEQCTTWSDSYDYEYGWSTHEYFDKEKFARLIVQECIKQAHSVGDLRGANEDMIYGADTAAVQISKHFGVVDE